MEEFLMPENIKFSGQLQTAETTSKVPLVPFKVLEAGIPFYTDADCTQMVDDACIYILQGLDPDDPIEELDIVPSTNKYEKGSYVTIGFDNTKLWEDCWFRDPDTGEIQKAWRLHTNYIGESILPESIDADKVRIADLEKKMEEKAAKS
jgi:hypothetical protein